MLSLSTSCSNGAGGGATPPRNEGDEIDAAIKAISDPPPPPELDEPAVEESSQVEGRMRLLHMRKQYAIGNLRFPILAGHGIYPGLVGPVRGFLAGIPTRVVARPGGGAIWIQSITGSPVSSVELDEVTPPAVADAANRIIAAQPERFAADLRVSLVDVRTREELQIAVRAGGSYFGIFEAEAGLQLDSRADNTARLLIVEQAMYTLLFARPVRPADFFHSNTTVADVVNQIGANNPLAYVSEVTYGRRWLVLVESTESEDTMDATLEANLNLGFTGIGGSGSVKRVRELRGLKVTAYAYGGDAAAAHAAVFEAERWESFKRGIVEGSQITTGLPLSYLVRSVATDEVIRNAVAADYTYVVRTPIDQRVPRLIAPQNRATLDNGSTGPTRDPVAWAFKWGRVAGAEAYEIQIRNSDTGEFVRERVSSTEYRYRGNVALRRDGWTWRVRARIDGAWHTWSEPTHFRLEHANADVTTGVRIYSHPNFRGRAVFLELPLGADAHTFDLERIREWDDELDSFEVFNLRQVVVYADPLRNGQNTGLFRRFTGSCGDVAAAGFPRNAASALRAVAGAE